MPAHVQDLVLKSSLGNPSQFWANQALGLSWHKRPSQVLSFDSRSAKKGSTYQHSSWFPDGELSMTYNCVDRHVHGGRGNDIAIIWESPVTGSRSRYTYQELLDEVEVLAAVLREQGVRKGDVVMIYMPMIPAALIAALSVIRLGAIHTIVFGGFAAKSLTQRMEAAKPRILMTASCGVEGSKGPVAYQPLVEAALASSGFKPEVVLVWQRTECPWAPLDDRSGHQDWQKLVEDAKIRTVKAGVVPVRSTDPVYILYTSGTTGDPKGIVRQTGGHAVGLHFSIRYMFDIHGPGDVMFCTSDMGWVVGHSYILYAPLLVGATTVVYEGKPVGTPSAGKIWEIIEEHKVTCLFTAPTAIRAIMQKDPENTIFTAVGRRGGLRRLKGLFLAGERSEPTIIQRLQSLLYRYAAPEALVIDNWWSSESGSPISGLALNSRVGAENIDKEVLRDYITEPAPVQAGSAGKPMPGYDVRVVDDVGDEVAPGNMGNVVLALPLSPTSCTTLFEGDTRFWDAYLKRFNGRWFDTGDAGMLDAQGYLHIMARTDDIINVAAHRLSTGAIEQAILAHTSISEAVVVGIPHKLKGHIPFAFVQTHANAPGGDQEEARSRLVGGLNKLVREQIGPIASLGGVIVGQGMIPKTRSGKALRRVLRDLMAGAVMGKYDVMINIPPTIEDPETVEVARNAVKLYFTEQDGRADRAKL